MKLEKLAIALLALYIVYHFMLKENYAFDETGLQFPADAGYIDIYHKKDKGNIVLDKVEYSNNISTGKARIIVYPKDQKLLKDAKEKEKNVEKIGEIPDNSVIIKGFTSRIPKSVLGYGVFYDDKKNVLAYRLMTFINATNVQVVMKPGNLIMLGNLTPGNLGSQSAFPAFKDGDIIHTGRFVFTF
jgi:hypothetical protein